VNLGQAVQATGLISGPLVSAYAFFNHQKRISANLLNVQYVYLGIGAFVFFLDALIFITRIPEITDADTELQAEESCIQSSDAPFIKQYRLFHASFAQWCYTGAQVAISCYFINYVVEVRPHTSNALAAKFLAIAQAGFALGRFLGSIVMNFVKPRMVLLFFTSAVIVFASLSTTSQYDAGLVMVILTIFFESVVFPTILALGMKGLGRHTKRGAGLIVAGISGGAVSEYPRVNHFHNIGSNRLQQSPQFSQPPRTTRA
jgi:FHS family L-fucose permease-like MFS transporter